MFQALVHNIFIFKVLLEVTWPPKSKFDPDRDISDLSGKVFIVTGANSGCGFQTAKGLLEHNATVYFACRDESKALKAIDELEDITGQKGANLAKFIKLDLASLKSIKTFAEEFSRKESVLDCLFNNAGVMWCPIDWVTEDGYDMQFGCNVIGHFYLTQLLLPLLLSAAKKNKPGEYQSGRIITSSSMGHHMSKPMQYGILKDVAEKKKKMATDDMYYLSKLGNILFSNELHRRYGNEGIISVSLNPGNIRTNLQRYTTRFTSLFVHCICFPVQYAGLTQLYAGTVLDGDMVKGKYVVPWAREGTMDPLAKDLHQAEKLWNWMEDEIKSKNL